MPAQVSILARYVVWHDKCEKLLGQVFDSRCTYWSHVLQVQNNLSLARSSAVVIWNELASVKGNLHCHSGRWQCTKFMEEKCRPNTWAGTITVMRLCALAQYRRRHRKFATLIKFPISSRVPLEMPIEVHTFLLSITVSYNSTLWSDSNDRTATTMRTNFCGATTKCALYLERTDVSSSSNILFLCLFTLNDFWI